LPNKERRLAAKSAEAKAKAESGYTLNALWPLFKEEKKNNRSFRDECYRYNMYLEPLFGSRTIPEITVEEVDRLRADLEESGKAPQTVKHVLGLLKRLFYFALRKGYLESLPGRLQHISMPTIDNKVTENLTQEQAKKLLEALDEEEDQSAASLVRLALFTGMRRGALLNLQWDDLDFERGFITLRGEVAKKKRTEIIPMNDQARAILKSQIRTTSPYVFPGKNPDKPRVGLAPLCRRVRDKAGLPKNFRPLHGLRHSFASWLASSGKVSMFELQKLLTHSTPQMTQRYAHLHDDTLRRASDLAGALFGQIQEK
jgi:integrase